MHVENWSGFKKHVIEQDFYAASINYNCAAIMVLASAPYEMQAIGDAGNRKGKWLATINRAFSERCLRNILPTMLLNISCLLKEITQMIQVIKKFGLTRQEVDRPPTKRGKKRKTQHNPTYKMA